MKPVLKTLASVSAALALGLSAFSASAAVTTQLGFLLDESGSMSAADYELMQDGLSAALAALPTDGSVEITVVSFASGVNTLVPPTVLTAGNLASLQADIDADPFSGGNTNTALGISRLAGLMNGSSNNVAGVNSFINIASDGEPTAGSYCTISPILCAIFGDNVSDQQAAVNAAAAAAAGGIDTISFEAISSSSSARNAMQDIAEAGSPGKPAPILATNSTNIPYPGTSSFVVPVTTFQNYAAVIEAKVIASVTPVPLPGTLALLGIGFLGLGAYAGSRRK